MKVVIKNLVETSYTYDALIDLIHSSFRERLEQGLFFTCSKMSASQLEAKMSGGSVFVAFDQESKELLGTVTIHIQTDAHGLAYGYQEYLAISPKVKRMGIATALLRVSLDMMRRHKVKYVLSDTACKAKSSVCWHLENGFSKYELKSYHSTNYWSYLFIRYLDDAIKPNSLNIKLHFWESCFLARALHRRNGSDTIVGKIINFIKKQ